MLTGMSGSVYRFYMFICVYIYIHIYLYISEYMWIYMYIYMYIYVYIWIYIYIHTYMCTYTRECVYLCIGIYVCVCVCIHMCILLSLSWVSEYSSLTHHMTQVASLPDGHASSPSMMSPRGEPPSTSTHWERHARSHTNAHHTQLWSCLQYRVAKTHRMSCLYRSFSAKEPYN